MFTIKHLQDRLADVPNLRPLAAASGLSEKTIYRVANGYSSVTIHTANKIFEALEAVYPVKQKSKPRAALLASPNRTTSAKK